MINISDVIANIYVFVYRYTRFETHTRRPKSQAILKELDTIEKVYKNLRDVIEVNLLL